MSFVQAQNASRNSGRDRGLSAGVRVRAFGWYSFGVCAVVCCVVVFFVSFRVSFRERSDERPFSLCRGDMEGHTRASHVLLILQALFKCR